MAEGILAVKLLAISAVVLLAAAAAGAETVTLQQGKS